MSTANRDEQASPQQAGVQAARRIAQRAAEFEASIDADARLVRNAVMQDAVEAGQEGVDIFHTWDVSPEAVLTGAIERDAAAAVRRANALIVRLNARVR